MKTIVALCLAVFACTPPIPSPVVPVVDASDAAPAPLVDAGPQTPCAVACQNLSAYCGPQQPNCETVWAKIDALHPNREPSGAFLTCVDVASATSAAVIRALGVPCP